jgi:hypothetical protein
MNKNKDKKETVKENAPRTKEHDHVNEDVSTSYYQQGYSYDPETEVGIQGAYGSQGQRQRNNSYKIE